MTARADRIPLAGTGELRADLRRSQLLRTVLAAALVAALAAALVLALEQREIPALLPSGSEGVVVLDVSGSVGPREYRQLARALEEAHSDKRRYGLVVFSDVAYEVFPPGTDSAQIRAVRRFFVPTRGNSMRLGTISVGKISYRASPWTGAFTGGTRISRGLELAREIVRRDRLERPSVLLISDLDFDSQDVSGIELVVQRYAREHVPLRIVGLAPSVNSNRFFDRLQDIPGAQVAAPAGSIVAARTEARGKVKAPLLLAGMCLALVLLVGVNELACGRLTWSPVDAR